MFLPTSNIQHPASVSARWELLTPEAALGVWDRALLSLDDYTSFQSYAWGEYRRALGWEPCHWVAFNEQGVIVAMLLGLVRRYPLGFGLVWCEGGPVGDLTVCDESLQTAIKETTGLKRVYCRFRCDRSRSAADALQLSAQGWNRSWFPLTSNFSMSLNLNRPENDLLKDCERNWRRNLNRATDCGVTVRRWDNPDIDELLSVYSSMQALKGLSEQQSRDEIEYLLDKLQQQIVLFRCDDAQGNLLSLSGWLLFGDRAWMWLSATSEAGRNTHASYAAFWALVQYSRAEGAQWCDLCGIDPVQNRGVYRFKKGSGAEHLEYLGEWDWAPKPWLSWFGNWAISRRERLHCAEAKLKTSSPVARAEKRTNHLPSTEKLPQAKIA